MDLLLAVSPAVLGLESLFGKKLDTGRPGSFCNPFNRCGPFGFACVLAWWTLAARTFWILRGLSQGQSKEIGRCIFLDPIGKCWF
jgi:hypothetical protein